MQLVDMILIYESKLKDMELEDMIENEKEHPGYYKRTITRSEEAMARYTKTLFGNKRGKNAENKIIKGKRKKTTKLRKG